MSDDAPLRDANRSFLAKSMKHYIPFLLEDTFDERNLVIARIINIEYEHSLEFLEFTGIGSQMYFNKRKLSRISPRQDKLSMADIITNMGFRIVKTLPKGVEYAD